MRAAGVWPGVLAVALLAVLAGCATPRGGVSAPPTATGGAQTGQASWYGAAHQGRLTASGEPYDMYRLTAAHLTLPLGTHVLVTNMKNGRSVEVRVNDRGPTVAGRIIDLSYAAARALDAVGEGVIPVRLRILSMPSR
jgi:rare lipoprotein A